MPEFIVPATGAGLKAELFLQEVIPAAPVGYLRQLFKKGKVKSDDATISANDSLTVGARISVPDSARIHELLTAPQRSAPKIDILYESREILIVNKPAGLAIHTSHGHERDNLTDRVAEFLLHRGDKFHAAPVQRLDLETSGPVLFGKGKKSCSELGKLFMQGEVVKIYLALVNGKLLGRGDLQSDIPAKGKLKTAKTSYQTLISNDIASLLELQLHTGRQHQIRRQFADAGHPLYGDKRYKGPCPRPLHRLFLHCRSLAFVDPFSQERVTVSAPLPKDLSRFLPQVDIVLPGH
ncbi:23S rRNA pseudouridine955/2504/2580 synthase [Desulfuromusa kysingii]|uniref:23S rRNA pseudouridine955/2504/2580 synthase n=1 Tax=Desulfuromusa kysingii TaxID=37625 RepID=A0A1H4AXD3_9BACT|nr:RluA family pseudouridine synthase [Desulfuromusa kysingii]SEA40525.1 23S rRNA pseudouridine955/2504/2580 synthase [Desulfuromusa kysingii]